jgi:hypothetical protein
MIKIRIGISSLSIAESSLGQLNIWLCWSDSLMRNSFSFWMSSGRIRQGMD